RPADEILKEIANLIKKGYREITLLGQNVNSYKSQFPISPPSPRLPPTLKLWRTSRRASNFQKNSKPKVINFPQLLKMINDLPGNFKIRFITAHPKDMTNETIKALTLPKMNDYLHLPVQSGSDKILKLMNRHYTAAGYLRLIKKIRRVRPDIKIGTDIIVGFPTETRKDFHKTVELCEKVNFINAYIAQYSPRAGTLAAKIYKDDIPPEEKKRRWRILDNLINKKPR
ncbi:MAG: radical SAM protein, partial [bacterium]|nr:radical SAM protein [bacterium]